MEGGSRIYSLGVTEDGGDVETSYAAKVWLVRSYVSAKQRNRHTRTFNIHEVGVRGLHQPLELVSPLGASHTGVEEINSKGLHEMVAKGGGDDSRARRR